MWDWAGELEWVNEAGWAIEVEWASERGLASASLPWVFLSFPFPTPFPSLFPSPSSNSGSFVLRAQASYTTSKRAARPAQRRLRVGKAQHPELHEVLQVGEAPQQQASRAAQAPGAVARAPVPGAGEGSGS